MPQVLNYLPMTIAGTQIQIVAGAFSIAASAGTPTVLQGQGWTVAKTTTGVYTITFADAYVALLSGQLTVAAATAVDLVAQIKSYDVVTAKTLVIDLNAGATPTEPAAVTEVHFVLFLRNSTVGQ